MSKTLQVVVPDQMDEHLEALKKRTGLSKSEIARRGVLDQVNELQNSEQPISED